MNSIRIVGQNSMWTKLWNGINRVMLYWIRPRITSWLCSILLISLGTILLVVPCTTKQDTIYLSTLLVTFPQNEWGIAIVTLGTIRLSSLISHVLGYKLRFLDLARIVAGMISCYIWAQLVIHDPARGIERSFETIVYAWIVVIEMWNVSIGIVDLE